jgi:imidazolonepropionase-like amidohydrolase
MGTLLIENGTVLEATGAAPKENFSLLIEDNIIKKIGPAGEIKALADSGAQYASRDAAGRTVMPGLVDCHVHPSFGDALSSEEIDLYSSCEYRTLMSALACRKVLRAGVTSMACPGSNWRIAIALRDAVNSGLIEGPRIAAGGHYISTQTSGSLFPPHVVHPESAATVLCNTRDEMISQVRHEVRDGVDIVKVLGDADTSTPLGETVVDRLAFEDLKAIADTTHLLGKVCTIHARSGGVAADASRAGFDWVIHASFMNDEQLSVVIENHTPINPCLSLLANSVDWGPDLGIHPTIIETFKRELEAASHILSKAYKAGVTIMAGTDSGQTSVPCGAWHAREMEHLIHYLGMSNMDAIRAGTYNAAFALRMQDAIGTLEEGKLADVLIVRGNPLKDIQVLQNPSAIEAVFKNGILVDRSTPLPNPSVYPWQKPLLVWPSDQRPDIEYVSRHAKIKPRWMLESH